MTVVATTETRAATTMTHHVRYRLEGEDYQLEVALAADATTRDLQRLIAKHHGCTDEDARYVQLLGILEFAPAATATARGKASAGSDGRKAPRSKGICPQCGTTYTLSVRGNLPSHGFFSGCPGGNKPGIRIEDEA
jgi:hypothetical protein